MTVRLLTLSILVMLGLSGCDSNPNKVDVKGVEIDFKSRDFSADLMTGDVASWHDKSQSLEAKYPKFFPLYVDGIMNLGMAGDPSLGLVLGDFATNEQIQELYEKVAEVYTPDALSKHMGALKSAFKRYHVLFPDKPIPEVITFISALRRDVVVDEGLLGISLDRYLGSDYVRYKQIGAIPQYEIDKMEPAFMNAYAMQCWMAVEFQPKKPSRDMLAYIIQHGKLAYASEVMFPEITPEVIHRYTPDQVKWCQENEFQIYAHFVEKNLFYTVDDREIIKYIGEGPFTSGFPKESPSAVGIWLGWKIVKSYVEKHGIPLAELMAMDDPKALFEQSGYKPEL